MRQGSEWTVRDLSRKEKKILAQQHKCKRIYEYITDIYHKYITDSVIKPHQWVNLFMCIIYFDLCDNKKRWV